jgi:hypothetical protein
VIPHHPILSKPLVFFLTVTIAFIETACIIIHTVLIAKEAQMAVSATPEYSIGDTVAYVDHHGRLQSGEVRAIEARWWRGVEPHITYDLWHPTYRNNRFYAGADTITGRAKGGAA